MGNTEASNKPDRPHILAEYYGYGQNSKSVVTVNQLAGIAFLPQVAGVFFGSDSHGRADQLAFHISSISGLMIVKIDHLD